MKNRHKLIMIITFTIIAVFEILIWINAYVDMKYIVEPCGNVFLTERMYMCVNSLSFCIWLNFALAIFLIILLLMTNRHK